jgi:ankyrin repeat protein
MADSIAMLLQRKADARVHDYSGNLPIHSAIYHRQAGCLTSLLLELGSEMFGEMNGNGDAPSHLAVKSRAWECLAVLVDMGTSAVLEIQNE